MSVNTNLYKCLSRLVCAKAKHLPIISTRKYCLINNLNFSPSRSKLSSQTSNIATKDCLRFSPAITGSKNIVTNVQRTLHSLDNGMPYTSSHILSFPNSVFVEKRTLQPYALTYVHNSHLVIPARQFSYSRISNTKLDGEEKKETGIIKKFKKMWKDYWYVVIPVHVITSIGWYGGFYLLIKSGVDIPAMLEWMGTSEAYVEKLRNSNLGIVALMFACYKLATPVRYTVTVGGSSWTVRYLSKKGYMTGAELKENITDSSDKLKKLDDGLQQAKERSWEMIDKGRGRSARKRRKQ